MENYTNLSKKELNTIAKDLKPIVILGKNGFKKTIIEEVKKQLKKRKLIKVKCLRNFLEDYNIEDSGEEKINNKAKMKHLSEIFVKETKCTVVSIVGFSMTLTKR